MKHQHLFLAGLAVCLIGAGCKTGTNASANDCGLVKTVCLYKTIHTELINGKSEFFELETPEARNDCEATYNFYFRWADSAKRLVDTNMPPLEDMAHGFQPGGEFAYFPHPNPEFHSTLQILDCDKNYLKGSDWWSIVFSIGNKNSSLPTTRYYVRARLDPNQAASGDSTEIYCGIQFFDKAK